MDKHNNRNSNEELYSAVTELEIAIKLHTEWLSRLHEYLICKQAVTDDILAENAHQICALGKWYYTAASELLKNYDEFSEIEKTHKAMHANARIIARKHLGETQIDTQEYRKFIDIQHTLVHLFSNLKEKILISAHSFDELTGAVRREAFTLLSATTHAEAERYGQTYCVVMIDLDHFKQVNDQHGHIFGDLVLKTVAQNINVNTRKTDILCRFGGEEFLLLLPKTTLEQSRLVVNKLRQQIETLVVTTGQQQAVSVTFSAGIAEWEKGMAFESILEQADRNLYSAKRSGRNRVVS